ncbi:MAG: FAD-dependent oxidoreductase [Clostridia bacterium]|nr:FAD-dependent oxidoreductase [Clostridia bacterium]
MKNIAIIGGGVAGLSAAIYALRANVNVTLFEQFGLGGLVATLDKIENYPSYPSTEGWELAQNMATQAKQLGLKQTRQKVLTLTKCDNGLCITTDKGQHTIDAVIVATGTTHNKLGIENDYIGKGVSYCATCDGNFYRNLDVAVVGSGNSATKEALYLADICKTVYLVANSELTGEQKVIDALLAKDNVELVYGTVSAIGGESEVQYIDVFADGATTCLSVSGVFVAVGSTPATDFVKVEGLAMQRGYIVVDDRAQTNVKGLYAAGDVTNGPLKQIVTACGDGAKAGLFAASYSKTVK